MMKCKECGNEISSRAVHCPFCGVATKFGMEAREKNAMSAASIAAVVLSVVGTILFFPACIPWGRTSTTMVIFGRMAITISHP